MPAAPFSAERLQRNLETLVHCSPEVARWLGEQTADRRADARYWSMPLGARRDLRGDRAKEDEITLVLGGGLFDEVAGFLAEMPPGHQVFVLEPRAALLLTALGRHDLSHHLGQEDLVLMAPEENSLEEALSRNPQLALHSSVQVVQLHLPMDDPCCRRASACLYHLWGRAMQAREQALHCERQRAENLVGNLVHAGFMGGWSSLAGSLGGAPAVLLTSGEGLEAALDALAGKLAGAAVFCCDDALSATLDAGILPTAAVITRCMQGPLSNNGHPWIARVPLVAEETAHAPTLSAHGGPVFVCLGPRGMAVGPLRGMSRWFTAQHHPLPRMAEVALLAGCGPLIVAGGAQCDPEGSLLMPGAAGGLVTAGLVQAAAAGAFGRVLQRYGKHGFNTTGGMELPRTDFMELRDVIDRLGGNGQPMRIRALEGEQLMGPGDLYQYGVALSDAASMSMRFSQSAAAPMNDEPPRPGRGARLWLRALDGLFVALSEQAAGDPMLSSLLEGCLVRAFRRRHRLACWAANRSLPVEEVGRQLCLCLDEMRRTVDPVAHRLQKISADMKRLGQSLGRNGLGKSSNSGKTIH